MRLSFFLCLLLSACSRTPSKAPVVPEQEYHQNHAFEAETQPHPSLHDDACALLNERPHWWEALQQTKKQWQIEAWQILAFMHQESRFNPYALSKSMAYGYPQAKDATWDWYKSKRLHEAASRERFDDAADFMGWYAHQNRQRNGVALNDSRAQYLAYHEGLGGYENQSYLAKPWLLDIADKVADRALYYQSQILGCLPR